MTESKLYEPVILSEELVLKLCQKYGINCVSWQLLKGGLINTSVKVSSATNSYLLRVYPVERTLPEIEFEMSTLLPLNELHLPVQKPLLALDGEIVSREEDRYFVFLDFIDGAVIEQPYDKIAVQIGTFIAQLHTGLKDFTPQGEKQPADIQFIDSEMSRLKESIPGQSDICDSWIMLRDALGSPELEKGVVHADIHPGNVVVSEDGDLKGVIDFDDCYYGSILFDLSIAAMSFSFESACKPNWNRAAKVVHAYEDERSKVDYRLLYWSMTVNCFRFYVYTVPLTLQDGFEALENPYFKRAHFLMDRHIFDAYSKHLERDS